MTSSQAAQAVELEQPPLVHRRRSEPVRAGILTINPWLGRKLSFVTTLGSAVSHSLLRVSLIETGQFFFFTDAVTLGAAVHDFDVILIRRHQNRLESAFSL